VNDDEKNGTNAADNPFGGLSIDFSNDIGAVPVANLVVPLSFNEALAPDSGGPSVEPAGGPHEAKLLIIGSGPAGLTAAIYARARQPRSHRARRLRAGRPAHDHQRPSRTTWLP
jgi:NADPH-dependent 2,4-dienoyl-CoA reductase/sulfur reductase-like enzyme